MKRCYTQFLSCCKFLTWIGCFLLFFSVQVRAQRQSEKLGRGVIALRSSSSQVYVGWRLFGGEHPNTAFNVYRSTNGREAVRLNASPISQTTDFLDSPTTTTLAESNAYFVKSVVNGVESAASVPFILQANPPVRQYLSISKAPASSGTYSLAQAYPGDVDGDGEFELVCRLSHTGAETPLDGPTLFDCYRLDGTLLWRVRGGSNLPNSNDGDGFLSVADYDGDGKSEIALRTSAGTIFQDGTTITDTSSREFLSIINGTTGVEMARTPFKPALGADPVAYWGENQRPYYLYMATAYLDGVHPSVITCRGIGGDRLHIHAWDFQNGALTERWSWVASQSEYMATGHNMLVFDLDNDGKDEILFIGGAIDDNGTFLYSTGLGHGDHFRFADLDPDRPGFECFAIQQDSALGALIYDGATGKAIRKWFLNTPGDPSRGDAGDVDPAVRGAEVWSTLPNIWSCKGALIGSHGIFPSRGIWWDRDLQREIYTGAGSGLTAPVINKINASHAEYRIYSIYNEGVSQSYGGFPPFSGDLLGDWREEVVVETSNYAEIRVYSTRLPAENRLYTLMHNPAYRVGATCKGRTGGISPDYYLGGGMATPPPPPICTADLVWSAHTASSVWNANETSNWQKSGTTAKFQNGQSVWFDLTGANASPIELTSTLAPSSVTVHSPVPYTFSGAGMFSGTMPLVKAGAGALTLTGTHHFSGPTTVWDGALIVNGSFTSSHVTVYGGTWGGPSANGLTGGRIAGTGLFGNGITLESGGAITPGNGMANPGTLTISGSLSQADGSFIGFDLSDDPTGNTKPNDQLIIRGDLNPVGTSTLLIKPVSGSLSPGTYTLITYSGTLTGSLANFKFVGIPGVPAFLANPPGAITLVVPETRPASEIVWTGTQNNDWDLAQSANWNLLGNSAVFVPGDAVRFENATSATTVYFPTTVNPASVTVEATSQFMFDGPGTISGAGGLTKSNSGTLTILNDHSYTGVTHIQGGTLEIDALAEAGEPSPIGAAGVSPANFLLDACTLRMLDSGGGFTNRGATLGPGGVTFDVLTTSGGMTFGGVITGAGKLTKTGPGTLQFTAANSHSGGTVIDGGTISLGTVTANTNGLGSGPVTFLNGTLTMANLQGWESTYWNLIVPAGATGKLNADGRCSLRGTLTGAGNFTVSTPYVRTDFYGDWSEFSGRLNLLGDIRVANSFGYGKAAVTLGDCVLYSISSVPTAGSTIALGELSGSSAARLRGAATSNNPLTWQIGVLNTDATFAGTIEEQPPSVANTPITTVTAIDKVGTGIWTLSGTHTHRGNTTVTAGTLILTGSISTSPVTIRSGATLQNLGNIATTVTVEAGGVLSRPGTISGDLINHGSVILAAGDAFAVNGTFTNYGTLNLGTWSGSLPENFINHGTILTTPLPAVSLISPASDPVVINSISSQLHLQASASAAIAHRWSQISGPGTVEFSAPDALATTAKFSATGAYVLEITVTNHFGNASQRLSVLVGSSHTYTFREGENDYSHLAAMIRGDSTSWNSGARDQFLIGKTSAATRAVFSFPLPPLPANAVSSVSLDVWTHSPAGTTGDLLLQPLQGTMIEGTGNSGSSASVGANTGVTWVSKDGQNATENRWITAGGDFNATVLSSIPGFTASVAGIPKSFPSTPEWIAAVRAALLSTGELSMLLHSPATTTANQYIRFASDDFLTVGQRPRLTVTLSGNPLATATPGTAPAATTGIPVPLSGSISNPSNDPSFASWSQISGPGTATFSDPSLPTSSVTFSLSGTYVLCLAASNPHGQSSSLLTVSVSSNPAFFSDWQLIHWPSTSAPEIVSPSADPDHDGLANLLEFALFLSPTNPNHLSTPLNVLPNFVEFTYTRARHVDGVQCFVEWSDSLTPDTWTSDNVLETIVPPDTDPDRVTIKASIPSSTSSRFIRLRATSTPPTP